LRMACVGGFPTSMGERKRHGKLAAKRLPEVLALKKAITVLRAQNSHTLSLVRPTTHPRHSSCLVAASILHPRSHLCSGTTCTEQPWANSFWSASMELPGQNCGKCLETKETFGFKPSLHFLLEPLSCVSLERPQTRTQVTLHWMTYRFPRNQYPCRPRPRHRAVSLVSRRSFKGRASQMGWIPFTTHGAVLQQQLHWDIRSLGVQTAATLMWCRAALFARVCFSWREMTVHAKKGTLRALVLALSLRTLVCASQGLEPAPRQLRPQQLFL